MKRFSLIFFIILTKLSVVSQVVNYNMNTSTQTVPCGGTFNFFDSGGSGGNYANNQSFSVTLVAGTPGQCLQITFSSFATEGCCYFLTIYSGNSTAGTNLGSFSGTTIPPVVTSTGGSLFIVWSSDGSVVNSGWQAVVQCVACPPPPPPSYLMNGTNVTIPSCPSPTNLFYDSGNIGGNYGNNENFTKTFTAPAGSCLSFTFGSFSTETCCDRLRIFDGPNGASPLIGTYAGTTGPGVVNSSGTSLTFSFTSDGSIVNSGWTATLNCVSGCSGMPMAGTTQSSTAAGCLIVGSPVTLSVSGSAFACGLTYQWQSAPALAGPWSNILGATAATYTFNFATNTFYRRITACGSNTIASVATSVIAGTPTVACSLSTYTAATTTYSFEVFAGTLLPTTDDVLFNTITMFGFPFCFGGSQYWGGYAASNSSFVFDGVPCFPNISSGTAFASGGASTGYAINGPAPSNNQSVPMNAILGPWHDINPNLGGTIRYYTTGVAPNRRFVLSYENIPMFSCGTSSPSIYFRGQIKIYETSNIIEIHIGNKGVCPTWDNGQAIMGLHSYDGTIYRPPVNMTAHNATAGPPYNQWTMTNTAYRFNSPCAASGPCVVLPLGFISFTGENQENKNQLNWKVETNSKFNRFVIERSLDGVTFSKIGSLNASSRTEYTYEDDGFKPFVINYYRISGIGKNNEISKTVIVPIGSKSDDFEIGNLYPNPTEKTFAVQINAKLVQPVQMSICNALGIEVHMETITTQLGYSTHQFKVDDLPQGLYIVKFQNKENQKLNEQKLVIGKGQ